MNELFGEVDAFDVKRSKIHVKCYRIADLCDINIGKLISKDYIRNNAGDYPVYSSQIENNGEIGKINTYMYEGEYVTWITDGANAGSVFYRDGRFSTTNVCGSLKVKDVSLLSAKYLYYVLSEETNNYISKAGKIARLSCNVMAGIKIALPSLDVQKERVIKLGI